MPGDATIVDKARTALSVEQGLALEFGPGDADEGTRNDEFDRAGVDGDSLRRVAHAQRRCGRSRGRLRIVDQYILGRLSAEIAKRCVGVEPLGRFVGPACHDLNLRHDWRAVFQQI